MATVPGEKKIDIRCLAMVGNESNVSDRESNL